MLRLVALCVVRCRSSSCVAFGLFVCCLLWFVVLRLVALCVVRCGLLSCVDLCVALRGRRNGS